jgi:serine/threonine protein phosphatase PrpC
MRVDDIRPPAGTPEIRAGAHSAKGLREENQDAMTRFHSRFGEVILVADGMGGHMGGAVASDMVAQRFRYHLDAAADATSAADALQQAAGRVNDEIYERGHSGDPAVAGMGSTLVAAVLRRSPAGQEVIVANAGDSRAYLVRDGVLRQLTKDHTAAQRMVDAGMLSPEDARTHPQASVLSRALGQQMGTTVETYPPVTLLPGDGLLLCSDGLSGYAMDAEITAAIGGASDPNAVVRNLVELALSKGSDDNITVQFLRLGGAGMEAAPAPATRTPRRKKYFVPIIAAAIGILLAGSAGWLVWRTLHKPVVGPQEQKNPLKKTLPLGKEGTPKTTTAPPARSDGDVAPKQPAPSPNPPAAAAPQVGPGGGESRGPTTPVEQQKQPEKKIVMLYVPARTHDPAWVPELMRLATVRTVDAETKGRFAPDRNEIVVWYRKEAKRDFDRIAARIPALNAARRTQDDSIPAQVDIVIVMPK